MYRVTIAGRVDTVIVSAGGYPKDINLYQDTIIHKIREKFILGAHKAFQFARELKWADGYLYSAMDPELIEQYHLHPIRVFEEIAGIVSASESIVVLPQATTTLPVRGSAVA